MANNNFYKKVFVSEIKKSLKDEDFENDVIKTIKKCHILGVITGIQKFSRRTVYSVDDGTGTLDCVVWHKESASTSGIGSFLSHVNPGNSASNSDLDDFCQALLNKVQINEEEFDYTHGDVISCLGLVKLVKRKLVLHINYHYKADNVNSETLWILDVLFSHKHK